MAGVFTFRQVAAPSLEAAASGVQMEQPRRQSLILSYGLPVAAGLGAFALAWKGEGELWSIFGTAALLVFAIAAIQWINHDQTRSPAQEAWRNFPEPSAFNSPEEARAYAEEAIRVSASSAQERRLNRLGVWLVVLAVALVLKALGVPLH